MVATAPVLARYPDFAALIAAGENAELAGRLRRAETIGRPVGSAAFLARLEDKPAANSSPASAAPDRKKSLMHCHRNVSP